MRKLAIVAALTATLSPVMLQAKELSLAYFMGPKHPMNAALMTPFAEQLEAATGGDVTVRQYPGGALNSVPPKQYSILLDGVADIVFTLPGYTAEAFPMTNVVGLANVCNSAVDCTEALQRARPQLEEEYNAKVLAIFTNSPPVLITRDKPVKSLADLQGMKVRVTSAGDVAFVESLGASAVTQPVNVINQNLANGVIDAIMIDPSAIRSFRLYEPANYVTTWFPGSGSAIVLLMNRDTYASLTPEQQAVVDNISGPDLSLNAARVYDTAAQGGLDAASENGVELLEWADGERDKVQVLIDEAITSISDDPVGPSTIGEVMKLMMGEN